MDATATAVQHSGPCTIGSILAVEEKADVKTTFARDAAAKDDSQKINKAGGRHTDRATHRCCCGCCNCNGIAVLVGASFLDSPKLIANQTLWWLIICSSKTSFFCFLVTYLVDRGTCWVGPSHVEWGRRHASAPRLPTCLIFDSGSIHADRPTDRQTDRPTARQTGEAQMEGQEPGADNRITTWNGLRNPAARLSELWSLRLYG